MKSHYRVFQMMSPQMMSPPPPDRMDAPRAFIDRRTAEGGAPPES